MIKIFRNVEELLEKKLKSFFKLKKKNIIFQKIFKNRILIKMVILYIQTDNWIYYPLNKGSFLKIDSLMSTLFTNK